MSGGTTERAPLCECEYIPTLLVYIPTLMGVHHCVDVNSFLHSFLHYWECTIVWLWIHSYTTESAPLCDCEFIPTLLRAYHCVNTTESAPLWMWIQCSWICIPTQHAQGLILIEKTLINLGDELDWLVGKLWDFLLIYERKPPSQRWITQTFKLTKLKSI